MPTPTQSTVGKILKAYAEGRVELSQGDLAGFRRMPKSMAVYGVEIAPANLSAKEVDEFFAARRPK